MFSSDNNNNVEIDGTMNLYLKIVTQFSYLSMLGVTNPMTFVIGLATNVLHI
jgi:hypothetical protein